MSRYPVLAQIDQIGTKGDKSGMLHISFLKSDRLVSFDSQLVGYQILAQSGLDW